MQFIPVWLSKKIKKDGFTCGHSSPIYTLHFDDKTLFSPNTEEPEFVSFVTRVLLHLNSSTLHSFYLFASSHDSYSCFVTAWISAVLSQKVQKLNLVYDGNFILCSRFLFDCKFLVELELCLPKCILKIPASVFLPYLKLLNLLDITLVSDTDSSSHRKELVLSFPVLKLFKSYDCEWLMHNVCLKLPLLEQLWFDTARSSVSSTCSIKFYTSCLRLQL
ncbi:hypothetical protein L6164_008826 [Bauhinia variegata]|uniref:Uncharacterized protein n=1 Tax=Bauhinia variegata TaxID=167791 RepID=A0ACB9PJA3_BAUVA|nr:hypothetical protein L6164_008826 [Bauhinia variegata]